MNLNDQELTIEAVSVTIECAKNVQNRFLFMNRSFQILILNKSYFVQTNK